jgi:hypothetical protein
MVSEQFVEVTTSRQIGSDLLKRKLHKGLLQQRRFVLYRVWTGNTIQQWPCL